MESTMTKKTVETFKHDSKGQIVSKTTVATVVHNQGQSSEPKKGGNKPIG